MGLTKKIMKQKGDKIDNRNKQKQSIKNKNTIDDNNRIVESLQNDSKA